MSNISYQKDLYRKKKIYIGSSRLICIINISFIYKWNESEGQVWAMIPFLIYVYSNIYFEGISKHCIPHMKYKTFF